jgi:CDP-paratose 2-epimerase
MRILITGGAGFVGSSLALSLKRTAPELHVVAFDNLRRRGSELALPRLKDAGIEFVHGDVRSPDDLAAAGSFGVLLDCAAEPSVQAGVGQSPAYVLHTNLAGTINCLEAARHNGAGVVFVSTSRVFPIERLRALPLVRRGDRLDLPDEAHGPGWSAEGIRADFPLGGFRSIYGATKLASELLIEEYRAMYGLHTVINRCGVLSGPWQMGKVDQGFLVLWASRHLYGGQLSYNGFGGEGLQVRDVLHVEDLCDLVRLQIADLPRHSGTTNVVGGGRSNSASLAELTAICRRRSGHSIPFDSLPETNVADIPYYVSDNAAVTAATGWRPRRSLADVVEDVFAWLECERPLLEPILGPPAQRPATAGSGTTNALADSPRR